MLGAPISPPVRPYAATLLLLPALLAAQSAQSIGSQRQSIRRQAGFETESSGFFFVPWPATAATERSQAEAPVCERIPEYRLDAYLQEIAAKEGFTPDLLRAVISKESAYYPCAVSRAGARGLMQLMPETAAELGVADAFDPESNIEAGARYLGELLTRYGGNLELALGAYNAGPARVDSYQGLPPIPETLNYVSDILSRIGRSGARER